MLWPLLFCVRPFPQILGSSKEMKGSSISPGGKRLGPKGRGLGEGQEEAGGDGEGK